MVIADGTKWGKSLLRSRGHSEMKEGGHSVPRDVDLQGLCRQVPPTMATGPAGRRSWKGLSPPQRLMPKKGAPSSTRAGYHTGPSQRERGWRLPRRGLGVGAASKLAEQNQAENLSPAHTLLPRACPSRDPEALARTPGIRTSEHPAILARPARERAYSSPVTACNPAQASAFT